MRAREEARRRIHSSKGERDVSAEPFDEFEEYCGDDTNDCDHENADVDLLVGRLTCSCGYTKWLTTEELQRERIHPSPYRRGEEGDG